MIRVGRFVRATVAFLLIVMLMTAVSLLPAGGRAHADPVNTFSGVLADQNGNPLSNTTVTLTNGSGNAVSAVTGGDGSFSVSASPDVYYLTLASTNTGGMNFMVRQSSVAPGIDLTAGSVAQNLTLPVATVNYTAYTAQGAPDAGNLVTASSDTTPGSVVSLYPGDPGETYVHVVNAAMLTAGAQGVGSFTSIVGANYTGGICDYTSAGAVIGCNAAPLTVGSGANSVSVPHAPLPHYSFSGVLADQHGNALAGVSLSLSDADGNVTSTTTGAGGAFSLSVVSGMYRISNLSGTNVDGFYLLGLKQTGAPSINLTAGNVTQNLTLPVTTVSYTAYDTQGYVNATGTVDAGSAYTSSSLISLYPGDPGEWASVNTGPINPSAQGTGTFNTLVGVVYAPNTICDFTASNTLIGCNTAQFTATSGTNKVVIPIPPTPANLTAASPTSEPSLSWTAVVSASSYNVYRDGVKIATTTTASFVDNNVSGGAHAYYVTAVDGVGDESTPSNTVTVTVNLVAPTLGTPAFTPNPVIQGQPTTVTVTVQGNLYGIVGGEYYIGNTDPGQGHGIAMTYSNGMLTATINNLAAGNQTIHVRLQSSIGWSSPVSGAVNVTLPIYSGTLTDQNGVALTGVNIILRDAAGNSFSTRTGAGGSFSLTVQPGMYALTVNGSSSGSNVGIYTFSLTQSNTTPSINLITGNITQHIVLPIATINYTVYNAQGYVNTGNVLVRAASGSTGVTYLYAGDPGELVSIDNGGIGGTGANTGSFRTVVGAVYGTTTGNGVCEYSNTTGALIGCSPVTLTIAAGNNTVALPQTPPARNTFSGTLTDQNGAALTHVGVTLRDAYGNIVSAITGADGSFSLAVEPGMYSLSLSGGSGSNLGIYVLNVTQSNTTPSLDLTSGNLVLNLVLPLAYFNYTVYNAQGYVNTGNVSVRAASNASTNLISLYAGDPGELVSIDNGGIGGTGANTGSFRSVIGVTYGTTTGNGVCEYSNTTGAFVTCNVTPLTIVSGSNTVVLPQLPPARNTFSGTLTDQDGNAIIGASVSLRDAYGNSVSTSTGVGGAFSLAVEPGMYALSISGYNVGGIHSFSLTQSTANPTFDLTAGNLTRNLVLQIATVNATLYNAQGYLNTDGRLKVSDASGATSLYAGDPGETFTVSGGFTLNANAGVVVLKTLAGAVYGTASGGTITNGLCDYNVNSTILYGCIAFTPVAGSNTVVLPQLPPARNTFSGTLTDQNGAMLAGVSLSLRDAFGNVISTTTGSNGAFSLAVEPGMYALSMSNSGLFIDGIYSFSLSQSNATPSIDLTSGSVIQNLTLPVSTVNFTLYDAQGVLNTSGRLKVSNATGVTSLYAGDPGETFSVPGGYTLNANSGVGVLKTLAGAVYGTGAGATPSNGLCDYNYNSTILYGCISFTPQAGTSKIVLMAPLAPGGLTATSPTTEPSLSWTAVSGVTSYNVYRDGIKIGSTTSASYVDTTAPEGTHTYYVKAVDDAGDASAASNTISVEVEGVDQAVAYYTVNDGSTFSKESTASASGVSTQTDNPDGTVTVSANNPTGYADSGFTTWTGTLGSLPEFTVTGSGDPFGLNIWFDTDNDDSFFSWDSNGTLTGLGADTYGISSGSTSGSLTVNGNTSFSMMDDGQSYTLAQLIAGDDPTSGINANTVVTIWIGVNTNSGSTSATIDSIGALQQV